MRQKYYLKLERAIDNEFKARREDPVAFAVDNDREIQGARVAFFEGRSAENYAAYKKQLQAFRLAREMPGEGIFSKKDAQVLGQEIKGADDILAKAREYQQIFGADYNRVMREIAPELGDRLNLALNSNDGEAARRLLTVSCDKDFLKNARALIPDWGDYGDGEINRLISENLESFSGSLLAGISPEDNSMAQNAHESVKRLAASYALNEGLSIKDAVRKAADNLINNNYAYYRLGNHTIRVPASQDSRFLEYGFKELFRRVGAGEIGLAVNNPDGRGVREMAGDKVESGGYLITDDHEAGVILFLGTDPLLDKNGQIARFDWDFIDGLGREREIELVQ